MAKRLPLLFGDTTLATALTSVDDMRVELAYPQNQKNFYAYLDSHRYNIEALVSIHLGLKTTERCRLAEPKEWMCGNFNVCLPVYVDNWARCPGKRVLIRFALPYKLAEPLCPGNVEEKLRCEAATFIWVKQNCPEVPIPHLWGFGFPSGQMFSIPEAAPYHTQILWYLSRTVWTCLGWPLPCPYIGRQYEGKLKTGYLIMEYVEESDGKLLSKSWTDLPRDGGKRANFFADLSRIMLSLARVALPRVGSMTINRQGFLLLENRPLTFRLQQLENKGIPIDICRTTTYATMEPYLLDLLSCHDSRMRYQANSIQDQINGETQLSVLAAMRAILPHFASRDLRSGPFVFTLTDVHPNNVFVNDDWHITCLIDLEWACVRPVEMILPPVWITGHRVDQLPKGDVLNAFCLLLEEFFDAFVREENLFIKRHGEALLSSKTLRQVFDNGGFWYFHALDNPKVIYNLFFQHIQPSFYGILKGFSLPEFRTNMMPFWGRGALELINTKLQDKAEYEDQLQDLFEC